MSRRRHKDKDPRQELVVLTHQCSPHSTVKSKLDTGASASKAEARSEYVRSRTSRHWHLFQNPYCLRRALLGRALSEVPPPFPFLPRATTLTGFKYRKGELFRRIKANTLVQLVR